MHEVADSSEESSLSSWEGQRSDGQCSAADMKQTAGEVCAALNVTVSPGPVVDYLEGENATLLCHVSQKRRKDSLLAVRWFFAHSFDSQEALMVKMTKLRVVQYYGNFSRSAKRRRLRLLEEQRGALYRLSVLTLQPSDQGHYVCRVQEISRHRNKWTAWSNGSSATEMRVISLKASEESSFEKTKETWAFFEDLYVYAVLVCCVGILSILLFMLVIVWQSVFNKRKSRVRHYLVKCPQNSSGETVTSVTSLAPLQPKKGKRQKEKPDIPPAVPAKAPIAPTFHKPKLLKPQRKVTLVHMHSPLLLRGVMYVSWREERMLRLQKGWACGKQKPFAFMASSSLERAGISAFAKDC
eukprot:XP_016871314.1 V-set and transmembrane domain-containing protein 4 isoform X1 [Homo sapiens]